MYQHPGYTKKNAPSPGVIAAISAGVVLIVLIAVFAAAKARDRGVPLTSAPGSFSYRTSPTKVFMWPCRMTGW